MKKRISYFPVLAAVFMATCILSTAGYTNASPAVESGHDREAIIEGAKQISAGNKMVVDIMEKKGIKDPDLQAANKMMTEGYDTIMKGDEMVRSGHVEEGNALFTRGGKMMMDADKLTKAVIEKHGMTQECTGAFGNCEIGEAKMKNGFQTYGLHGDWEPGHM
jgi:hypothetical protein